MTDVTSGTTDTSTKQRLYLMMFLQYFVQGCYLPIVSVYVQDALGFTSTQMGIFGSALAVGPLFAPFILGQLVDRLYATEKVIAFCHLVGGGLMLAIYMQTQVWPTIVLACLYSILYVPTMMLTNALAFHHLKQRDREFPLVRLWGTVGFIVPAWFIEFYWMRGLTGKELDTSRSIAFLLSGGAEVLLAFYCLTLPHTPPKKEASNFAPGKVMGLLARRDFLVLVLVGLVVAVSHKFFFVWNSPFLKWFLRQGNIQGAYEQTISSIGQVAEIVVMIALGVAILRFGFKTVLTVGIIAYLLRALFFAAIPTSGLPAAVQWLLLVVGQSLHGFCFACFWATAYMYVDRVAPVDVRGSMQTFFGTLVFGLGMFAGGFIAGLVGDMYSVGEGEAIVRNWSAIWLGSAVITVVGLVGLLVAFRPTQSEGEA